MSKKTPPKVFTCSVCGKTFASFQEAEYHDHIADCLPNVNKAAMEELKGLKGLKEAVAKTKMKLNPPWTHKEEVAYLKVKRHLEACGDCFWCKAVAVEE